MSQKNYTQLRHDLRAAVRNLTIVIDLLKTRSLDVDSPEGVQILLQARTHSEDLLNEIEKYVDLLESTRSVSAPGNNGCLLQPTGDTLSGE